MPDVETKAIDLIYSEVLFAELYESQAGFHDLCRFLSDRDYTLYGLYNLTSGRDSILAWGDADLHRPSESGTRWIGAGGRAAHGAMTHPQEIRARGIS